MAQETLKLKFVGALVEQLGAQLYPSATATVAELISNAWDADAHNVWVKIPFGQSWTTDGEIEVLDDGHGMTRAQAQSQYLIVGRKRRLEDGGQTQGGRLGRVHTKRSASKMSANEMNPRKITSSFSKREKMRRNPFNRRNSLSISLRLLYISRSYSHG